MDSAAVIGKTLMRAKIYSSLLPFKMVLIKLITCMTKIYQKKNSVVEN